MPKIVPALYAHRGTNRPEQIGGAQGLPSTGNTFNRHTFVVLTAGALAAVATGATLACGLTPDASNLNTVPTPPTDFFGGKHFPYSLPSQRFAISVTDGSGHFGQANGAPQGSAITIGSQYGIYKGADGNHYLNSADTTNKFFQVIDMPPVYNGVKQDVNTYNPVVIVEVVASCIQIP